MTDHKTYISGTYKGFYITINTTPNGMYRFKIGAHSDNDPGNAALRDYIESRKGITAQIQSVDVSNNSVTIVSSRTFLIKKVPEHLNEAIMPIVDYLASNYYVSGCMQCGTQTASIDCYDINGGHHYLCGECAGKVEEALADRKQDILSQKSKLIPGIVGALFGALIGAVVYFLIYQLGYIAAVAGLITAVCAFKGYEMLGGVVDKKGVVACVIIIIFAVFFANKLAWSYEIYKVFKEVGATFFDCFRFSREVIAETDLVGEYYTDLVISYVLTALGSFGSIKNAFKTSSGSYKVKKMKE